MKTTKLNSWIDENRFPEVHTSNLRENTSTHPYGFFVVVVEQEEEDLRLVSGTCCMISNRLSVGKHIYTYKTRYTLDRNFK